MGARAAAAGGEWLGVSEAAARTAGSVTDLDRICREQNLARDNEGGLPAVLLLLGVFVVVLLAFLIYVLKSRRQSPVCSFSVPKIFYVTLGAFVAVRLALCYVATYERGADTAVLRFVLHRFSPALFSSSFAVVLFYWMEQCHQSNFKNRASTDVLSKRAVWALIATNLVVFGAAAVLCLLLLDRGANVGVLVKTSMLFSGAVDLLLSLGFLVYGLALLARAKRAEDAHAQEERAEVKKMLTVMVVFVACFLCRVFMEVWLFSSVHFPLVHASQPSSTWFDVVFWRLPEIMPALAEIFVVQTSAEKTLRDSAFIDDLYRESDEGRRQDEETEGLLAPSTTLSLLPHSDRVSSATSSGSSASINQQL